MDLDWVLGIGAIILGWTIFGCVCSYALPQFIRIIKTKNTSSMSVVAYFAIIICAGLMCSWGIGNTVRAMIDHPEWNTMSLLSLIPNVMVNVLNVTVNLTSLIIKFRHMSLAKKYGITELELANRLLKAKKAGRK